MAESARLPDNRDRRGHASADTCFAAAAQAIKAQSLAVPYMGMYLAAGERGAKTRSYSRFRGLDNTPEISGSIRVSAVGGCCLLEMVERVRAH